MRILAPFLLHSSPKQCKRLHLDILNRNMTAKNHNGNIGTICYYNKCSEREKGGRGRGRGEEGERKVVCNILLYMYLEEAPDNQYNNLHSIPWI